MMPSFGLPDELQSVEKALAAAPGDPALLLRRASALDALGRSDAAREAYVEVIRRDPGNADALNNLGTLLFTTGYRSAARLTYSELLRHHPHHLMGLVNLGNAELEEGLLEAARGHYEQAIEVDPSAALAHQGLSYVLMRLGEKTTALRHREIGFALSPLLLSPYRGSGVPVTVLLILAPERGNIATDPFLDSETFLVAKIFPEYYDESLPLPPHDVIFNAVGDAELAGSALEAAQRMLERSDAPVINQPRSVLSTSRADVAERLRGIPGVIAPRILPIPRQRLGDVDLAIPFLVRSPGYHTGEHFERVTRREDAETIAAALPGETLLAIEFLDARGIDGATRKYRVLCIDGVLYPVHLARSTNWKVHYYSADLVRQADALEEEARFLTGMEAALGARAVRSLEAIFQELDLDYCGVDFGLDREGNVLVFEANATMKVIVPARNDPNRARADAAHAALKAARDLVLRRARPANE